MTTNDFSRPDAKAGSDPRLGQTWALPGDATCAGVARSLTGAALARRALSIERIRDAELMMSELATNAYEHARGHPPPELWLYPVRDRELICAVFDTGPEMRVVAPAPHPAPSGGFTSSPRQTAHSPAPSAWPSPSAPPGDGNESGDGNENEDDVESADPEGHAEPTPVSPRHALAGAPVRSEAARADFGRGLALVHELSGGRWGIHRSRSRLSGSIPGKVVWFGVPLPRSGACHDQGPPGSSAGPPKRSTDGLEGFPAAAPADGSAAGSAAGPAAGPVTGSGSGVGSTGCATAAHALKELLVGRGTGPVYLSHRDGLWVVALRYGLTVWIRDGRFELPGGTAPITTPLSELPVVVEHLVRRYEQHRLADS